MLITSRDNATVKEIRSLRTRKAREETGLYFIEGVRMVAEAIDAGADIETIVVCQELLNKYADELQRFQDRVQRAEAVPHLDVSAKVFESIAEYATSEGIGAVVCERWEQMENVRLSDELCWIAVNSIQNPSNLGTLLRISDAVGGRGLILIGNCTDPYHPIAVRASLGAVFSQSVVRASFAELAAWKRRHGYRMVGTSPTAPLDYRSVTYEPPFTLFLGNEWFGLTEEQQQLCDLLVKIPMAGRIESHNVAVAAGIVLYEALGQRGV